jgi:hypothetical protein
MTLQIVCRTNGVGGVVELHGWLGRAEVVEFHKVCASTPLPFRVDLTNLTSASVEGILALKEERAKGVRLVGASPYIALLLRDEPQAKPGA